MPRRRELKSIASGMATFCVCRNNDIGGYWGLGVLCKHAQELSVSHVSIEILSDAPAAPPIQSIRGNFRERFGSHRHHLSEFARGFYVKFEFEPYSKSDIRGTRFRGTCSVSIVDDLGISRSATASKLCYSHNPQFECKSTRG